MIWIFDLLILILVILCAVAALSIRDMLGVAIFLAGFSFLMCLMWAEMTAVDVAFTEAAVGAGISTILFIAAILRTVRRSKD